MRACHWVKPGPIDLRRHTRRGLAIQTGIAYNPGMYQSELTQFLEALKKDRPHLEVEQRRGRALWWDKLLDRDRLARQAESRLQQPGYVYQTSTKR